MLSKRGLAMYTMQAMMGPWAGFAKLPKRPIKTKEEIKELVKRAAGEQK